MGFLDLELRIIRVAAKVPRDMGDSNKFHAVFKR